MPGTAWYHPHFHGSTAIQTGQGAAGMLIVDDPPGYLPKQIEDMEEINLMIQHLNIDELKKFANTSGFEWWIGDSSIVYGNATTETGNTNMMLLNMQYIPKITVQQGKWSSTMDVLIRTAPNGCELQLLAKVNYSSGP
jgi:FtsP/CotA-like multicopper oxidase with cupredoxin domain